MCQLGLISNGPDNSECFPFPELFDYGRPYSVLFNHIGGVARCLLQAFLQILLRGTALQVMVEVSHHPEERWEVGFEVIWLLRFLLSHLNMSTQIGNEGQILQGVFSDRAHLVVDEQR